MNFERIAPIYSAIELLTTGSRMQRSRVAHLAAVGGAKRVLIVGEGNGRFLEACATALPEAEITVIDESPAMLRRAEKRWKRAHGKLAPIQLIHANFFDWSPRSRAYDVIVTHFFLDCFPATTIRQILEKLSSAATPDARWLLADFCEPPNGLARLRAQLTLRTAYAIFRLLAGVPARELTSPDRYFQELSYTLAERIYFDWGMIHSDLWIKRC